MRLTFLKLKDVIEKPISGEWGDGEGEVNVLRTTNFTNNGILNLNEVVKRNIQNSKVKQKQLIFGDTIIEKSGGSPSQPVGRVVYFNQNSGKYLCNNFTSIIRAKSNINKRYLFWFLYYNHLSQNTLKFQNKTTGIINLQLERYINEVDVPLPPLPIQEKIAEILDFADKVKRNDQLLLEKLDELARSAYHDIFGDVVLNEIEWEKVPLSHFIKSLETGVSVNSSDHDYDIQKKCVLKTSSVYSGYFNPCEAKVIQVSELNRAKLNPQKNSIIISRMNTPELVGMSAFVDDNYPNLYLPDRLWMSVKTDIEHSVLWLSYVLKSQSVKSQINKIASGTSGSMKNISKKEFLNIMVFKPDLELQYKFESILTNINSIKRNLTNTNSENLFDSVIQKAFNGELVA